MSDKSHLLCDPRDVQFKCLVVRLAECEKRLDKLISSDGLWIDCTGVNHTRQRHDYGGVEHVILLLLRYELDDIVAWHLRGLT